MVFCFFLPSKFKHLGLGDGSLGKIHWLCKPDDEFEPWSPRKQDSAAYILEFQHSCEEMGDRERRTAWKFTG